MTTTVTYAVNYAGDFTTLSSAFSGIGTDLTVSSSGHVLLTGSTSSVINLSALEGATDYTGHTLTISGVTCLITSYNTSTQVATVSARAGFPANFGSAPSAGTAYTIDSVAAVLTVGQSAAGNNKWTGLTALTLSATTDATHTIAISGATPWNASKILGWVNIGPVSQAVGLQGSTTAFLINISSGDVIVNDLALNVTGDANSGGYNFTGARTIIFNRCLVTLPGANSGSAVGYSNGGSGTLTTNNCVYISEPNSGSHASVGTTGGTVTHNNSTFYGGNYVSLSHSGTYHECAFFGFIAGNYFPYGGETNTRCAADDTITGCTTLTRTGQFVSLAAGLEDMRPASGSGLLSIGGVPFVSTDIFGATRSATASTIGAVENVFSPPAIQNITYAVNYSGDITGIAPGGPVSTFSWATGTATATTTSPHGVPTGQLFTVTIQDAAIAGPGGYEGVFDATSTGTSTFTYPIASSPGSPPVSPLYFIMAIESALGCSTGDLSYYSLGSTCSGTAADSFHIVLSSAETIAVLRHPIQWKTGATCMITAYDTSTNIATVSAAAGYPANFGGTPQSGDAYTIFPTNLKFSIGQSASGNNLWTLAVCNPNQAAVNIGPCITTPSNAILIQGTAAFSSSQALGIPQTTGSAIGIKNGDGTSVSNHTAVFGIGCANITMDNLQGWCTGVNQEDGLFVPLSPYTGAFTLTRFNGYGDNATNDEDHSPFFQSVSTFAGVTAKNCNFIGTQFNMTREVGLNGGFSFEFCSFFNTSSFVTTTVGTTNVGATTINVASAAGFPSLVGRPLFIACPGYMTIGSTTSISGTAVTVAGTVVTTQIPAGTKIYFGPWALFGGIGSGVTVKNCAMFGTAAITSSAYTSPSFTTCATDVNPESLSGVTSMVFADQVTNVYQQSISGGTLDARPKSGNGLQIGTFDGAVTTDIFGTTRANPPTIGAIEYVSSKKSNFANILLMGVG